MGKTFAITGANGFIAAHRTPLDAARARARAATPEICLRARRHRLTHRSRPQ